MTILVTGGAGFIGSEVVRQLIGETDARVVNLDALTYAGNLDSLEGVAGDPRYRFLKVDLRDGPAVREAVRDVRPGAILHLAAESHVDRSIDGPLDFLQTNIIGTFHLLDAALEHCKGLSPEARGRFRFLHVSTDEVYGSLGAEGFFTEASQYQPNSPYSASKAASDHLARAWHHTYGLPVVVTNCSNNYGPYQFPEKLIPLMIRNAIAGKPLPVYGEGLNVRDWLYVGDHARALRLAAERGRPGEVYVVGGRSERRNIDVVRTLCALMDEFRPEGAPHDRLISHVADRPGHDHRYAIDPSRAEAELGWKARETFETGLRATVRWYLENDEWCERIASGSYRGERLGLAGRA